MKRLLFLAILSFISFSLCAQSLVYKVEFIGNKKGKSEYLKQIINTQVGTSFNHNTAKEDLMKLKRLAFIANALYTKTATEQGLLIRFKIEEKRTIIPGANFYTTNNDEFAYRLSLYEYNLLGKNITIGGFYQKDVFDSYRFNFRAPFLFFKKKFGLALSYTNLTTEEPVFLESTTLQYKYNNTGYEIAGLYQFNLRHRIELGAVIFNESYDYLEGENDGSVPTSFSVDKFQVNFKYAYNNTHTKAQYISGFMNVLNLQQVTSSDDILPNFIIGWNDFLYYKRIARKGNFAGRLRTGLATNDPSPFAPFAVDNNINVRGVGNIIDRGTGVVVINAEYRHTVYEKDWFVIQSNVFFDAGSWRTPKGELSDFVDPVNFRIYPGAGIRFIHKKIHNAIFRIDYGYGVSQEATQGFVFGIGQYF